jgi:hypothetical protein
MINSKTNGYVSATYNPLSFNFSLSSNSITGIIVEIEGGYHKFNNTKMLQFINGGVSLDSGDFVLSGNQKLIIKSQDQNNLAVFSQGMSLSAALDQIATIGSSAYDII